MSGRSSAPRPIKCLLSCQRPLSHALSFTVLYLLACSLARNGLTNDDQEMSGLLKLVEVLPLTKIESLECAPASIERLCVSALDTLALTLSTLCSSFHSLTYNDLSDGAQQALKDVAGSSVRIISCEDPYP